MVLLHFSLTPYSDGRDNTLRGIIAFRIVNSGG